MAVKFYPAISGIKITKLSTATGVFHHSIYVSGDKPLRPITAS